MSYNEFGWRALHKLQLCIALSYVSQQQGKLTSYYVTLKQKKFSFLLHLSFSLFPLHLIHTFWLAYAFHFDFGFSGLGDVERKQKMVNTFIRSPAEGLLCAYYIIDLVVKLVYCKFNWGLLHTEAKKKVNEIGEAAGKQLQPPLLL